MAKVFKKQKQSTPSGRGKDYYAGLTKETYGDKTYAIEPTGEKTLLDEEGDPVMDIELNPHLYPEYTAKFANNPNPDVEIPATPGIKDTQDQMAWNAKWNRQEENARNKRVFRKEVKFQEALGEGNAKQAATDVVYPKAEEFEWANPVINEEKANQQSQEKQIAALVNSGMTVEDATQQVITGKPVNEFFSPNGNLLVKTKLGWQEVIGSGQNISPEVPFVDVQEMMKSIPNEVIPSKNLPNANISQSKNTTRNSSTQNYNIKDNGSYVNSDGETVVVDPLTYYRKYNEAPTSIFGKIDRIEEMVKEGGAVTAAGTDPNKKIFDFVHNGTRYYYDYNAKQYYPFNKPGYKKTYEPQSEVTNVNKPLFNYFGNKVFKVKQKQKPNTVVGKSGLINMSNSH